MSKKLLLFSKRGIKGDFHGRVPMLRIASVRGRFVEPINSIATQPLSKGGDLVGVLDAGFTHPKKINDRL